MIGFQLSNNNNTQSHSLWKFSLYANSNNTQSHHLWKFSLYANTPSSQSHSTGVQQTPEHLSPHTADKNIEKYTIFRIFRILEWESQSNL